MKRLVDNGGKMFVYTGEGRRCIMSVLFLHGKGVGSELPKQGSGHVGLACIYEAVQFGEGLMFIE